jgi:hypothetical protein
VLASAPLSMNRAIVGQPQNRQQRLDSRQFLRALRIFRSPIYL